MVPDSMAPVALLSHFLFPFLFFGTCFLTSPIHRRSLRELYPNSEPTDSGSFNISYLTTDHLQFSSQIWETWKPLYPHSPCKHSTKQVPRDTI